MYFPAYAVLSPDTDYQMDAKDRTARADREVDKLNPSGHLFQGKPQSKGRWLSSVKGKELITPVQRIKENPISRFSVSTTCTALYDS